MVGMGQKGTREQPVGIALVQERSMSCLGSGGRVGGGKVGSGTGCILFF